MPLQRNDFVSQNLLTVYTSQSQMTDPRTGLPYQAGGSMVGIYFDLTEAEAQNLSGGQLHEGRYRFVQIDSTATAANVVTGTIGLMTSLALGVNNITSYDKGLAAGLHPVIFLAPLTAAQIAAGAFVFVQEEGDANVKTGTITASAGAAVESASGGVIVAGSTAPLYIGALEANTTGAGALVRVQLDLPVVQG